MTLQASFASTFSRYDALRQQELILPKKWCDEIVAPRDHYDRKFFQYARVEKPNG